MHPPCPPRQCQLPFVPAAGSVLLVHAASATITVTWCHFSFSRCDLSKDKKQQKTESHTVATVQQLLRNQASNAKSQTCPCNMGGKALLSRTQSKEDNRNSEVEQKHSTVPLLRNPQVAVHKYFSSTRFPLSCPTTIIELVPQFP